MPSMRFAKWLLALLCLAIGLAVWLFNRAPAAMDVVSPPRQPAATSVAPPAAALDLRVPAGVSAETATPAVRPPKTRSAANSASFWGKVIASESSLPIQGAVILGLGDSDIQRQVTDAGGSFNIASERALAKILRIDAAGFGPVLMELVGGHESIETAMTIPLLRAATLEARVSDRSGAPIEGLVVSLSSPAHALARPEGAFLFHTPLTWSARTGATGVCTLPDLPPDVALSLSVLDAGRTEFQEASPLTLQPGELRRWEYRRGGGIRLFGVAIDEHRAAVGGLELWLAGKDATMGLSAEQHYFHASLAKLVVQRTKTDNAGRYSFVDVPSGEWLLGPAPTASKGGAQPSAAAPIAELILIDANSADREVVVKVHAGLHVRGRVLRPDGQPGGSTMVYAVCDEPAGTLWAQSQSDGQFSLGPFAPGELRLMASGTAGFANSEYVRAQAGSEEVLLQLRLAARLQVFAVDAATGAPVLARFFLKSRSPVESLQIKEMMDPANVASGLVIDGLLEGTYDISGLTADGRIGAVRGIGVSSGAPSAQVTLRVAPAAQLRVRLLGNTQPCQLEVESEGALRWFSDGIRPGASKLVHVPAGAVSVRLRFRDQVIDEREVIAALDQVVEVDFQRD